MSRGVSDKITYKPYNQGEQWLLPPSLDELVPQNHFVRIVSKTVDELEIEEIFVSTVKLLNRKGYVSLEKYFVDGTKIESAANKYTFVWKKAVEKNEKKLDEKLKKAKRQIEKDYLPRKEKYEKANATFNNRNSYSKTDEDATFMRMKEDHMLNGQLKPGYNIQVGTENNFVIGYDVFPNPTDTRTFIPHLENVQKRLGCKFKFAIADAGYGSEENYDYLEKNEITGIVKYTTYEKEIKRSFKKKTFNTENWKYDAEQKAKVKELLSSEEYKTLMKKRSTECETVFGQTKGNLGFRRFHLRGKEKVGTEWGLLMLGYDFKQLIRLMNA